MYCIKIGSVDNIHVKVSAINFCYLVIYIQYMYSITTGNIKELGGSDSFYCKTNFCSILFQLIDEAYLGIVILRDPIYDLHISIFQVDDFGP